MSAETLRRAANLIRETHRQDVTREAVTLVAVADWLDIMADPHAEGYRGPALRVALAYLEDGAR